MPTTVTINDVTGTTPFYVYLCDNPIVTCIYIDEVNSFPYNFNVPAPADSLSSYTIKIIDGDGCIKTQILTL